MADYTVNILKPSVNNLTVRVFMRAGDLDFEGPHAMLGGLLCSILGSDLRRVRRRFARTLESHGARRRPRNRIALRIGDGDHRVVERRIDVGDARRDVLAFATANTDGFLGHLVPFQ